MFQEKKRSNSETSTASPMFNSNSSNNLFGNTTSTANSGTLFSSSKNPGTQTTDDGPLSKRQFGSAGGLFGSSNNTNTMQNSNSGLFGGPGTSNNTTSGGGLFGGSGTNNATQSGGGLFGGSGTSNTTQGGGLFGGSGTGNTPQGGGLFGASGTNNGTQSGGLFGNSNTNQQSNSSGTGLFGQSSQSNTLNSNTQSAGLFGNNTQSSNSGGFGGNITNQASLGSANPSNNSLFGSNPSLNTSSSTTGLFGQTNQAQGQPSMFNNNMPKSSSTTNFASAGSNNMFGGQNPMNASANSSFGTPNQSILSVQTPLVASIDQASYSLNSSVNSSLEKSLGPLTSSRRGRSGNTANNTPTSIRKGASHASLFAAARTPLKAAPSPRAHLSGYRQSPYSVQRRRGGESQMTRTKSMFFAPSQSNSREVLRNEKSFDNLALQQFTENQVSDVKRLVIDRRTQRPIESIVGKKKQLMEDTKKELEQPQPSNNGSSHSRNESQVSLSLPPSKSNSPKTQRVASQRATFKPVAQPEQPSRTFELNEVALQGGYWMSPNLHQLCNMSEEQLRSVDNLTIGRKRYGQIHYNKPIDLTTIQHMGEVLGRTVIFERGIVCIYPNEQTKAEPGHELNQPATVKLENAFAVDKHTKQPITDPNDARIAKHIARLRKLVETKGGEFVSFDVDTGSWTFKVPHFSVWGLVDEDDDSDEDVADAPQQQPVEPQHQFRPHEQFQPQQQFQPSQQFEPPQQFQLPQQFEPVPNVYDVNMDPDVIVENIAPAQEQQNSLEWAMNSDFPPIDQSDSQPLEDTFGGRQLVLPSNNEWGLTDGNFAYSDVEEDEEEPAEPITDNDQDVLFTDGFESELYARPTSNDWVTQLQMSDTFDSPLAIKEARQRPKTDEDAFTAADLDNFLFGGASALDKSSAHQYRQAAEKLRLPEIMLPRSFACFNQGTGKLITFNTKSSSNIHISYLETRLKHTNTYPEFGEQLKLSNITRRSNGTAKATPGPNLTFKFLHKQYENQGHLHELQMWKLASLLFDKPDFEVPQGYDERAQDKVYEKWRRRKLSEWLESHVSSNVDIELEQCSREQAIITNLTGNRIIKACEAAVGTKNLHLATLIPMLGTADRDVRADARQQLDAWVKAKAINDVPEYVRKVYELLAGNTSISHGQKASGQESELPSLYLSEGLDWWRAFGMRLWYETSENDPIAATVEIYREAFENGINRVAQPLAAGSSTKFDICYQLLRLYGAINPSLVSVLEPVDSSELDFRVPWHIYQVLVHSSRLFKDFSNVVGDRLSVNYACQLEAEGRWIESLFVLAHVADDVVAKQYTEQVLSGHVDEVAQVKDKLVNDLQIDPALVNQAQALKCRYDRDYLEEAYNLIDAGLWEEAHRTVITNVAPRAVIQDKCGRLIELLSRFKFPDAVPNWKVGGQMYLDYAKLKQGSNELGIAERLLKSLSEISVDNFDIRVASNIMGAFAGGHSKEDGAKLLSMKLSGNEYLQQTVNLSVDYFKQKLAAL